MFMNKMPDVPEQPEKAFTAHITIFTYTVWPEQTG